MRQAKARRAVGRMNKTEALKTEKDGLDIQKDLVRFARGEPLRHTVDKEKGY